MKLIIGLGNPETRYDGTRHNIGFAMLDRFAEQRDLGFKQQAKFKSLVAEYQGAEKVLLLKPLTYYNDSGMAARAVMDFYKVDATDILIIHDDLALPIGHIRTRIGGSSAGNNGVKSITASVGQETARLRIGIWNEQRNRMDDVDFVLGKFTKQESQILDELLQPVYTLIDLFTSGKFEATTLKS